MAGRGGCEALCLQGQECLCLKPLPHPIPPTLFEAFWPLGLHLNFRIVLATKLSGFSPITFLPSDNPLSVPESGAGYYFAFGCLFHQSTLVSDSISDFPCFP